MIIKFLTSKMVKPWLYMIAWYTSGALSYYFLTHDRQDLAWYMLPVIILIGARMIAASQDPVFKYGKSSDEI